MQLLLFQAFLVGQSEFASTRQNARTFKLDNRTVLGFATKTGKVAPPIRAEKHGSLSSGQYQCANGKRNLHSFPANLHLVEGASHFTYFIDPFADESQEIFAEMALFWDSHLRC